MTQSATWIQAWKIAPGDHASDWNLFRDNGCIGIGWLEQMNLGEFKNEAEVLKVLESTYGEKAAGFGKGAAEMIWSFVHDIQPNHIVVANDAYNRVVGIGTITSGYHSPMSRNNPVRTDESTHRHHVRRVNWIITKPVDIPGSRFFVQRTLKSLSEEEVETIIQTYLAVYPNDRKLKMDIERLFGKMAIPKTPVASDQNAPKPERVLTSTYRILRDTTLARRIKVAHNFECQICGETIELVDGSRYAEAHHVKPLGRPHDGDDIPGNILCLCPNHHAECDLGVKKLAKSRLRKADGHDVDEQFIGYHNREIFGKSGR